MFILKNIDLELKSALRTKYIFYQSLLYIHSACIIFLLNCILLFASLAFTSDHYKAG